MSSIFKKSKSSPFDPWEDLKIASEENKLLLQFLNRMEGRKLFPSGPKELKNLELFRGVKGGKKGRGKVPSYQENLDGLKYLIKLRENYEKSPGRNPTTATKFEQLDLAIALHKEVVQNIKNRSDRVLLEDQTAKIKRIEAIYGKDIRNCNINIDLSRTAQKTPGMPLFEIERCKRDISAQKEEIRRLELARDAKIEKLKQRYAAADEVSSVYSSAQKSGIDIEPTSKEKDMVGTYRAEYYKKFRRDKPPEATRGLPIVKAAAAPAAATATTAGASAAPAAAAVVPPAAAATVVVPPVAAAVAPAAAPAAAAPAAVPSSAIPAAPASAATPAVPAKPIAAPADPKVAASAAPAAAVPAKPAAAAAPILTAAPRTSPKLTDEPQKPDTSLVVEGATQGPDTSLNISGATQGAGPRAKVAGKGLSDESQDKDKDKDKEEQKPEGEGDAEKTLGVEKERKKISKSGEISWDRLIKEIGELFTVIQEVKDVLKDWANMKFDKRNTEKAKKMKEELDKAKDDTIQLVQDAGAAAADDLSFSAAQTPDDQDNLELVKDEDQIRTRDEILDALKEQRRKVEELGAEANELVKDAQTEKKVAAENEANAPEAPPLTEPKASAEASKPTVPSQKPETSTIVRHSKTQLDQLTSEKAHLEVQKKILTKNKDKETIKPEDLKIIDDKLAQLDKNITTLKTLITSKELTHPPSAEQIVASKTPRPLGAKIKGMVADLENVQKSKIKGSETGDSVPPSPNQQAEPHAMTPKRDFEQSAAILEAQQQEQARKAKAEADAARARAETPEIGAKAAAEPELTATAASAAKPKPPGK